MAVSLAAVEPRRGQGLVLPRVDARLVRHQIPMRKGWGMPHSTSAGWFRVEAHRVMAEAHRVKN